MKNILLLSLIAGLLNLTQAIDVNAQSKLEDRLAQKVKQRANRKVDRTMDKGLDKIEKGIDDEVSGENKKKETTDTKQKSTPAIKEKESVAKQTTAASSSFEAYTKFDFIPGDAVLFYDDFSSDNVGDFPSKWTTNGAGEVITGPNNLKWFELKLSSYYLPATNKKLPEDYTIEFDVITQGITQKTSSNAGLIIMLDDNTKFTKGRNYAWFKIHLAQYTNAGIKVISKLNGEEQMQNTLKKDLRKQMINGAHISMAVNKKRFRMWVDEQKVIDMPTLIPPSVQQIKLGLEGFTNDFESGHLYINNFKIAEGGIDLRSKLITEGKLSTTAITFTVNSDKLKPESMGIIKEIAGVLEANPDVAIKIIGHTDSDGDEGYNLKLSQQRSAAVKRALTDVYNIKPARIQTEGKGESQPTSSNETAEGKAANRRVDFIKL